MASPAIHPFETRFAKAWPTSEWCDSHIVLAVSAGPDSVAMLRAALSLKAACGGRGRLHVAHLNHAIRGAEADDDVAWLEQLSARLNIPIAIGKANVPAMAAEQGDGLEAAARSARYSFLTQTAERLGGRFVAVAHTADDQVETVLQRILRGTGLAGLAGIPSVRLLTPSVTIVRPLLEIRRQEVLNYLADIGQDFRTDSSNSDPRPFRNWLRLELLPLLRERYNADVDAALLRLATQAAETQQLLADMAADIAAECVAIEFRNRTSGGGDRVAAGARIDCRRLSTVPSLVAREVCRLTWTEAGWPQQAMGFDKWQQLAKLLHDQSRPPINLPGNLRARREKEHLVVEMLGLP
jgi:tRNA(Ile)-lysidine synthase